MIQPITMPKLGQSEEVGTLVKWRKKAGDAVARGDILFEIETDKAVLEVESFFAGTLLKIVVDEGATVPINTTVGYVGDPGETVAETSAPAPAPQKPATAAVAKEPAPVRAPAAASKPAEPQPAARDLRPVEMPPPGPAVTRAAEVFRISPRAARLAKEAAINPGAITGTGPLGRIVEKDVRNYLETKGYNRIRITPAARKLAAEEGIDLLMLEDATVSERITVEKVRRAIAEKPRPMSRMRQVIASRLTASFTSTPHFFVTVSVDVTELSKFRAELKAQGASYTITDFIMKAVALSLVEFPTVNSTTDGKNVLWHSRVQLGLAVNLEQGLVVPVIRDAGELSLAELHDGAAELAAKARAGKLTPDEMSGSTFTISNMGMMNVESFTAIINPGESAILAVSSTTKQPVVRNDQIVIREIMKMTLSSDHRIIDGAMAANFSNAVKNKLEEISLWKRLA
jgi:pyruvate dehydrogenase E2 component (dihydrolipoamide acetyltransferase)